MEIIRKQLDELLSRMAEPRKCLQVLAGPRQVGKTTLALQFVKRVQFPTHFVSADNVSPSDTFWIAEQWQSVRTKILLQGWTECVLVIDEIQKINNWSEQVKREWDADTRNKVNLKVVLLGSSRLLLKDGLTESLAGRFELIRVPHWTLDEMQQAFDVSTDQYMYFGGYPGASSYMDKEVRWRKYMVQSIISPAIEKDVLMTRRILKPALLKQLFEVGCAYSGELLSYTKILGQLQDAGNSTTLANYMEVLSESNLLTGLQKFSVDFARRYQSIPKYQVFNNALLSVYQGRGFEIERIDPPRWGRWVESAVGAYLLHFAEEYSYHLYYWRDRNEEVDFVLTDSNKRIAIEVKSGRRKDNSGIHSFQEKYHPTCTIVVGNDFFSVEEFLRMNLTVLFQQASAN